MSISEKYRIGRILQYIIDPRVWRDLKNRDGKKNKSWSKKLLATDMEKFRIPIALDRVNKRSEVQKEGDRRERNLPYRLLV